VAASFAGAPDEQYLRRVKHAVAGAAADDVALVDAMQGGDERALASLYDRHAPLVMGLAMRIVRDATLAESVVLETFTQVWNDARRYDPRRASVPSWIVTIARSRALDAVRATQRQGRLASLSVDDAPDAALAAQDFASNPAGAVEAGERRSAVAEALGALPDPQRQAVELAFFEGLSQSEIAERLAVPLGTIKTRIRLAMTKLRQLLGPHGTEALV
jgi:RNA polymerase sigma-70 factor (ECF subfamily)